MDSGASQLIQSLSLQFIIIILFTLVFGYYTLSRFLRRGNEIKSIEFQDLQILLFYNPLSGGFSKRLIKECKRCKFERIQLVNLEKANVSSILDNIIPTDSTRIIICGGDISFYLLHEQKWSKIPPVCLNPYGTGNDLAKAFDCSFIQKLSLADLCAFVLNADLFPLDRWNFSLSSGKQRAFNNYMSFGVDATILSTFNRLRKTYPFLFFSQPCNILWYTLCILYQYLFYPRELLSFLKMTVDGKEIDCSSFASVVCLNIPFYCGGGNPIGVHFGYKQCCDEEIEVVGFTSIPHIIFSKFGWMKGTLLAKGKSITWNFSEDCPVETDGESWVEKPTSGTIEYAYKVQVFVKSSDSLNQRCKSFFRFFM